jgi:acyl-coenzyme A thioesterase PaaI-like protein
MNNEERFNELRARLEADRTTRKFPAGVILEHLGEGAAIVKLVLDEDCFLPEGMAPAHFIDAAINCAAVHAAMSSIPAGHTAHVEMRRRITQPVREADLYIRAAARVIDTDERFIYTHVVVTSGEPETRRAVADVTYAKPREAASP